MAAVGAICGTGDVMRSGFAHSARLRRPLIGAGGNPSFRPQNNPSDACSAVGIRFARRIELLPLPIFAVKQIADCSTPGLVYFAFSFALFGAQAILVVRLRLHCFRRTTLRTPIGESRLIWPQFEFFTAIDTGFDWKCHQNDDKTDRASELTASSIPSHGKTLGFTVEAQ